MPAFVIPQILLCGLFVPRSGLPGVLHGVSDVLPLSYAVDGMRTLQGSAALTGDFWRDLAVITAFVIGTVGLGAATLRRRTA
jgi:ABC-2 type transport system permease protein